MASLFSAGMAAFIQFTLTICTKDRTHYFGEIENDEMFLNELGLIVKSEWEKTPKKLNIEFGWQARFHDHIMRNYDELIRISNYIQTNPQNWKGDKFFM